MEEKENLTNPYLMIAEEELNKELVWFKENNKEIVEAIMDRRNEIVHLICDEIQANYRIQELIRDDVFEAIRECLGTSYEIY